MEHDQGKAGSDKNLNRKFRIWSFKQRVTQGRVSSRHEVGLCFKTNTLPLCVPPRDPVMPEGGCVIVTFHLGKQLASRRWGWVLSFHAPRQRCSYQKRWLSERVKFTTSSGMASSGINSKSPVLQDSCENHAGPAGCSTHSEAAGRSEGARVACTGPHLPALLSAGHTEQPGGACVATLGFQMRRQGNTWSCPVVPAKEKDGRMMRVNSYLSLVTQLGTKILNSYDRT